MKKDVYACLLAGGKGTRLWPLSTETCSKSFISIGGRKPLAEEAIDRLKGFVSKKNILIVVDEAQKKYLKGIRGKNILVEPFGRSTASAVGLAAIELKPDDIMVVLPTDSLIGNRKSFIKSLKEGVAFIRKENALLCVGIKPHKASVLYGHIKVGKAKEKGIYPIVKFIEKPKEKKAKALFKTRKYLWNAGIYIFKAGDILLAIKKHAPLLYRELNRIKRNKNLKRSAYLRMKNVSIDYQIIEKAKNLYCVKGDFKWQDLGSWNSVASLFKSDKKGNYFFGNINLEDTKNSIIYNSRKRTLDAVGLRDKILVNTENGVLFCNRKDAERLKELVALSK